MSNFQGVLSTSFISQLSRSQLSMLPQPDNEEIAIFLIGLCPQATEIFYQSVEAFQGDRNFQNVVMAHLVAECWVSSFQVPPGTVIALKALEPNTLDIARYDLACGFTAQSLQTFVRAHTANHVCLTVA